MQGSTVRKTEQIAAAQAQEKGASRKQANITGAGACGRLNTCVLIAAAGACKGKGLLLVDAAGVVWAWRRGHPAGGASGVSHGSGGGGCSLFAAVLVIEFLQRKHNGPHRQDKGAARPKPQLRQ